MVDATPPTPRSAADLEDKAEQAEDHPVIDRFGRIGFAAKGALHVVMGLIALSVGFAAGDASQSGAISALAEQPFGTALLVVLAVGLACYGLLRLLHVVSNPSDEDGLKGAVMRASYLGRAIAYGGLTVVTVRELAGADSGEGSEQRATQALLELPLGNVLVAAIGLGAVVVGGFMVRQAWTRTFMDLVPGCPRRVKRLVEVLGTAGHAARGLIFATIGLLFGRAALQSDPSEAGGVDEALQELATTAIGTALLVAVAVGLVVYGLFCLAVARWGDASAEA